MSDKELMPHELLYNAGFTVIPCTPQKTPLNNLDYMGRFLHKKEKPRKREFDRWCKDPNVSCWGLLLKYSHKIFVVDCDGSPAGIKTFESLGIPRNVETYTCGSHIYVQTPPGLSLPKKSLDLSRYPGMKIIVPGTYVIFEGIASFHNEHGKEELCEYGFENIEILPYTSLPEHLQSILCEPKDEELDDYKPELLLTRSKDWQEDQEELEYIVEQIFPIGAMSQMAGQSKLGKSTIVSYLAACISDGKDWLGMKTTQCDILYFPLDDTPDLLAKRLKKLNIERDGILIPQIKTMDEFTDDEKIDNLPFTTTVQTLRDYLEMGKNDETLNIKFVVIDSLQNIFPASLDISKGKDAFNYLAELEDLIKYYKVSLLLINHMNKPNTQLGNPSSNYAGSSVLERICFSNITLTYVDPTKDSGYIKVTLKGRANGRKFLGETDKLEIDFDNQTAHFVRMEDLVTDAGDNFLWKILNLIINNPDITRAELLNIGPAKDSAYLGKLLKRLEDEDYIIHTDDGVRGHPKKYKLNDNRMFSI